MKQSLGVILTLFVLVFLSFATIQQTSAQTTDNCEASFTGSITALTSTSIQFDCSGSETIYFGVCDSGNVPNDDLFTIEFNGMIVSSNTYNGGIESVSIGSATASAGSNTATLNSTNTTPFPPATYSYAVSTNSGTVSTYLNAFCGSDFSSSAGNGCLRPVPLFTTDQAPSNGRLVMNVQFGDYSREEGITVQSWDVVEGQQINNETGLVLTPQHVRVWWQAEGSSEWYLLPSQYWQGEGKISDEYGLDCQSSVIPSYHTSFANAIAESNVPEISR